MLYKIKACLTNIFYKDKYIEYATSVPKSRSIRTFNYETLIDSYQNYERRRFYDLNIISILNNMNYTSTNAGEQHLLQHFLSGNKITKHMITEVEEQLLKQIGYAPHLNCYTFFNQTVPNILSHFKRLRLSLWLLPLWLILSYFSRCYYYIVLSFSC